MKLILNQFKILLKLNKENKLKILNNKLKMLNNKFRIQNKFKNNRMINKKKNNIY